MEEETLNNRLYNAIGFIRTMKQFSEKRKDKRIEIDNENLEIILKLLKDCKDKLNNID